MPLTLGGGGWGRTWPHVCRLVVDVRRQRDLVLISEEVTRCREVGVALRGRQAGAGAGPGVAERLEELDSCWASIQDQTHRRGLRLREAEDVQKYLSRWAELR